MHLPMYHTFQHALKVPWCQVVKQSCHSRCCQSFSKSPQQKNWHQYLSVAAACHEKYAGMYQVGVSWFQTKFMLPPLGMCHTSIAMERSAAINGMLLHVGGAALVALKLLTVATMSSAVKPERIQKVQQCFTASARNVGQ